MNNYTGAVTFYEATRGRGVIAHMVTFDDTGLVGVMLGDRENSWSTMKRDLDTALSVGATVVKVLDNEQGEVWMTTLGEVDIDVATQCLQIAIQHVFDMRKAQHHAKN